MARAVTVWISGLLACGIFGALIGDALIDRGGIIGLVGGVSAFVCLRLWLAVPPKNSN